MSYKNGHGYVVIYRPEHPLADAQGRVLEHRLKWYEAKGPFSIKAIIHHKNGQRDDNRIQNLAYMASRGDHARSHFPHGFVDRPWNKGMKRMVNLRCNYCGLDFTRTWVRFYKAFKVVNKQHCSRQCALATGRALAGGKP